MIFVIDIKKGKWSLIEKMCRIPLQECVHALHGRLSNNMIRLNKQFQ